MGDDCLGDENYGFVTVKARRSGRERKGTDTSRPFGRGRGWRTCARNLQVSGWPILAPFCPRSFLSTPHLKFSVALVFAIEDVTLQ